MNIQDIDIQDINISLSGVIPVAAYENLRPGYSMTVKPKTGQNPEEIIVVIETYLHQLFDLEANRAKIDLIEKQYANIRFREKDGKKYPSVTSILGWDKDWKVTQDELQQYASCGTIIHRLVNHYLTKKEWLNPDDITELKEDMIIVLSGNLQMSWENYSYKAFCEQYADKIKPEIIEGIIFNEPNLYSGEFDIVGDFDGVRSLMDIKSGTYDMRQLAAYAVCLEGIKQLVVLPMGKTDNKCGYMKPVICNTIQNEFEGFLRARANFQRRFGI